MYQQRIASLEILKTISTVGVVIKHTIIQGLVYYSIGSSSRWTVAVGETLLRRSVPMFLMITGILLLKPSNHDDDIADFYRSRLIKVIIPLLVTIGIFITWDYMHGIVYPLATIIEKILTQGYYYHLRYVLVIIGVYMIIPFIRILLKHISDTGLIWYIALWLGWKLINITLLQLLGFTFVGTSSWFLGLDGYIIIGYALWHRGLIIKHITIPVLASIFIITVLITLGLTYYSSVALGVFTDIWYAPNMPTVIIMSMCMLGIGYHLRDYTFDHRNGSLMAKFAQTRFGIYLIHPLWIMILMSWLNTRGIWFGGQLIIASIGSVIASFITIYMIQLIPGATTIFPKS